MSQEFLEMNNSDLSSDESIYLFPSASEASDDEEDLELLLDEIRPKNTEYLQQTIPQYSDELFLEHFRISRHVANSIADRFANSVYYTSNQAGCYGKLSAQHSIYIFLWFAGHQTASFRDVADRFDVTISSLFRIIRRVMYFLSNLSHENNKVANPRRKKLY